MELHTKSIKFILPAVILPPVLLVWLTILELPATAALSMGVIVLSIIPFFLEFEQAKPRPRDLVPIAVMSALGALGRGSVRSNSKLYANQCHCDNYRNAVWSPGRIPYGRLCRRLPAICSWGRAPGHHGRCMHGE